MCVLHPLYLIDTLPLRLGPATISFDLSMATKLKDLVFRCKKPNVQWVTRALQSIKSKDLERITLRPGPYAFTGTVQEAVYQEWWDLDRLLVQFRTSLSVFPKVVYEMDLDEEDLRVYARYMLPGPTGRELVDVFKRSGSW